MKSNSQVSLRSQLKEGLGPVRFITYQSGTWKLCKIVNLIFNIGCIGLLFKRELVEDGGAKEASIIKLHWFALGQMHHCTERDLLCDQAHADN